MYKKPVQPDDTFWRLEAAIKPGKFDDFIAVAQDLFVSMDGEAGTLGYGYYLNEDKTVCHIHEHYRDSEGLRAHGEKFARVFSERFMAACTVTHFVLYGEPDAAAKEMMAQYGATYMTRIKPLSEVMGS
jgi:quinol monooxygenase YgiN